MSKVSIIIVTYNGEEWIEKCLKSVPTSYQIIVVDNNSTDDTLHLIETCFKEVVVLAQGKNLGFGAANNIGISYALKNGVDYVFLLNQDAYLQPNTIEKLIEVHKSNIEYGIISPIHLNGNGDKLDKNFSNYIKANDRLLFDALQQDFKKSIYRVPFVNAAGWLIPRNILETVGGFDPIFYHYAEDDNFSQRVLFHSFKIGVVPNTYIYHDRENRELIKGNSSKEDWTLKERYLKCKWANINVEVDEEIMAKKRQLQLEIFRSSIKLKFRKANYKKKVLRLINGILPDIKKSRAKNKLKGVHYLRI